MNYSTPLYIFWGPDAPSVREALSWETKNLDLPGQIIAMVGTEDVTWVMGISAEVVRLYVVDPDNWTPEMTEALRDRMRPNLRTNYSYKENEVRFQRPIKVMVPDLRDSWDKKSLDAFFKHLDQR